MSIELKIKSKHLAEEPRIIKHEERKLKKQRKWMRENGENDAALSSKHQNLAQHRRWDVRNESRATNLARAYIAGATYSSIEQRCTDIGTRNTYIVPRVVTMVQKYHCRKTKLEEIIEWMA